MAGSFVAFLIAPGQFVTIAQTEPATLENPQLTADESFSQSDSGPSAFTGTLGRLRLIQARIGPFGLGAVVLATIVSVSGAIWAIRLGAATPIAIMVGYCTLVATVCLTVALSLLPKPESKQGQSVSATPAVSEAWKHVSTFSVSDAARLWCDVEPGATVTQDIIAWGRLMLDAIASGELACIRNEAPSNRPTSYPSDKPHWCTEVTRDALQTWAHARGFEPGFLQNR